MSFDDTTRIAESSGPRSLAPGTELNGIYAIDALIATGGMGEVYRGHNISTGEPVAIKVVLPELARDTMIVDLFQKEARILGRLSHDAIVRYHLFAVEATIRRPYLAMEFVDGVPLADLGHPLDAEKVRRLIQRIAAGLGAAHAAGVIHRDLSPDNVILPDRDVDRAKIIDFGIARSLMRTDKSLLKDRFAGKYNFVSPEQVGLYGGDVTTRSDIYSLGLVALAALRGEPVEMGGSELDLIEKRRRLPDLSDIDPALGPLLAAMLQPDPKDRPGGMEAVALWLSELDGWLPGEPRLPGRAPPNMPRMAGGIGADASMEGASAIPPASGLTAGIPGGSGLSESPFAGSGGAPIEEGPAQPAARRGRGGTRRIFGYGLSLACLAVLVGAGLYAETITEWWRGPASVDASSGEDERALTAPAPVSPPPPTEKQAAIAPQPPPLREPAVPSVPAPVRVSESAARIAWIRQFSGGSCFYALPLDVSGDTVRIEAYADRVAPAERMLRDFQNRFGPEPDIEVRLVSRQQCPALAFLGRIAGGDMTRARFRLDRSDVASGSFLTGDLADLADRSVALLLTDSSGVVQNVTGLLQRRGDSGRLSIGVNAEGSGAAPQLLLAVVSDRPLQSAETPRPVAASPFFARLAREIEGGGRQAAASVRYFRIRG